MIDGISALGSQFHVQMLGPLFLEHATCLLIGPAISMATSEGLVFNFPVTIYGLVNFNLN